MGVINEYLGYNSLSSFDQMIIQLKLASDKEDLEIEKKNIGIQRNLLDEMIMELKKEKAYFESRKLVFETEKAKFQSEMKRAAIDKKCAVAKELPVPEVEPVPTVEPEVNDVPEAVNAEPAVIPVLKVVSAVPEVVASVPEVVYAVPEVVSAVPDVVDSVPEVLSAVPEVVTAEPEVKAEDDTVLQLPAVPNENQAVFSVIQPTVPTIKHSKATGNLIAMLTHNWSSIVKVYSSPVEVIDDRGIKSTASVVTAMKKGSLLSGQRFKLWDGLDDNLKGAYLENNDLP